MRNGSPTKMSWQGRELCVLMAVHVTITQNAPAFEQIPCRNAADKLRALLGRLPTTAAFG
jgi:hypothetical protein